MERGDKKSSAVCVEPAINISYCAVARAQRVGQHNKNRSAQHAILGAQTVFAAGVLFLCACFACFRRRRIFWRGGVLFSRSP